MGIVVVSLRGGRWPHVVILKYTHWHPSWHSNELERSLINPKYLHQGLLVHRRTSHIRHEMESLTASMHDSKHT